jgi:hypothetical protein
MIPAIRFPGACSKAPGPLNNQGDGFGGMHVREITKS